MAREIVEVMVRGDRYSMAVEDDDSLTITRQRPGSPPVVVGQGNLHVRTGLDRRYATIECSADLGEDVYLALEAEWMA